MASRPSDTHYEVFADALRQLLAQQGLRERFLASATQDQVRSQLGISKAMAKEIEQVLTLMPGPQPIGEGRAADSAVDLTGRAVESFNEARSFLDGSFGQLRVGFWVTLCMSGAVFLVGLSFLIITVVQAIVSPENVKTTAVVGGLGIVQIVAVFYRNPLKDIQHAVSNAQQAKMTIMSYMLGISLIGESAYSRKETSDESTRLMDLTRESLQQLQHFTEPGGGDEDESEAEEDRPAQSE